MPDWELKNYNGREIKTGEDIIWVCEEIKKVYENNDVKIWDQMALLYIEKLHQEVIDSGYYGFIDSRFDILDL